MSSGLKKFMHKVGDKLDISKGHHSDNNGGATKDAWPQSGDVGAPQTQGVGQMAAPSSGQPTAFPDGDAHKATDASRLAAAPPTFQDNKMAPSTDFSFNTSAKPKVMTSEPTSNTSALGKSPVYSPLGSSAHESVASEKPKVTDVGPTTGTNTVNPSSHLSGNKGSQQPFSGTLPHVGDTTTEPKLSTTDKSPVSSKTGAGAPNPMTHPKDIGTPPGLATKDALPSAFRSDTKAASKPGSHMDELKDAKAKAGSSVDRSPNLTGDTESLGAPPQESEGEPKPIVGGILPPYSANKGTHVGELKDAKAKAGSAVNRSPDLTGDIDTLGAPAQDNHPKPMVGAISPPYQSLGKDGLSKSGDKGYASALDKIVDDKPGETGAAAGTGMLAGAAGYVHAGARKVAESAHPYTDAGDKDLADKAKETMTDTNAQGTKSLSGPGSTSGRRVTTPPDDKSFVQQAKEGIAAAAAVTADKASQAYQVVQDKAYETGIPQKLGEHANTARDAAAQKYNDLTTEAQKQHAAYRDVASDRLATAKAQAQDYAQSAQQRAADHMDRVRNASPEDINRSSLGRMVGGIALLWLASYAIGIPFKYGLAGALLAISAVLFAEWDQGSRARRARNSRTNLAGSSGHGKDTGPEGPDSIPKFGSMGGIDAKTGAPPASIHESSIGDISSGAKQNFPQDPISHGIGSGSATHGAHGASPYGGSGLGSDSGAGPTVTPGGLGQSSGAKASSMATQDSPSSFYHTTGPSHATPAENMAHVQSAKGAATGGGFDSTYCSTEPTSKVEQLQPTAAEKSKYILEE